MSHVTKMLNEIDWNPTASERLLSLVYSQLRKLAATLVDDFMALIVA